ncbi:MAG: AraC family transcriptional regulator [Alteromonadaceae bacterium]|nr:MAG: AraC family transcriptional regulator [Alteromonadaceae bacterium]
MLDPVAAALAAKPLSSQVEDLKKAALELNRDLLILEEELLFPASTQIAIFLSVDIGKYFKLDSVKILIDDKLTASHLYTKRQNRALSLGGLQRIYLGNIKSGEHEVTAFFVGMGPDNREYKRGATIVIDKDDEPKMLELQVRDSSASMQPEFKFKEWEL